jgi:hypothetical protein
VQEEEAETMRALSARVQQCLDAFATWSRRSAPRRPFAVLLVALPRCAGRACGAEANPLTVLLLAHGGWVSAEGYKLVSTLVGAALLVAGYRQVPRLALWLALGVDVVVALAVVSNAVQLLR